MLVRRVMGTFSWMSGVDGFICKIPAAVEASNGEMLSADCNQSMHHCGSIVKSRIEHLTSRQDIIGNLPQMY